MNNLLMQRFAGFVRRWPVVVVLTVVFLLTVVWWVTIYMRGIVDTSENYWYTLPFTILPFTAGLYVLKLRSIKEDSLLRKAVILLAIGLLFWGFGNVIYMYYNLVLHVPVPCPSLGEVGYGGSYIFWSAGLVLINISLQLERHLKTTVQKILFFLLPFIFVSVSYYLFFVVNFGGHAPVGESAVKFFFDIYYLFADTLQVFLLAVPLYALFAKIVDRRLFVALALVCFGFLAQYIADFAFAYTTFRETYFIANWVDLLYAISIYMLSVSIVVLVRQLAGHASKKETFNEQV